MDTLTLSEVFGPTVPDRIIRRLTARPNDCWSWSGAHTTAGYACVWWEGSQRTLHNVLYGLLRGNVPDGLVLDHVVCEDKSCPNPWHVKPETNVRNMLRSPLAPATINRSKSVCIHGHSLNDCYIRSDGRRRCRTCDQDRSRDYQRKRRREVMPNGRPDSL